MLMTAERVVTGSEVLRPGWLQVRGERIAAIGSGIPAAPADVALGAVDVVPGFVDMHVHGGGSGSFSDAAAASTLAAVGLHRAHGTTSMLASLVSAHPADLLRQVGSLAEQVQDGVIAGIHLEGPWLSSRRCGAHDPTALRPPDPAEVDAVLAAGRGAVRMITLAPELEGALEVVPRIVDAGAAVAVGHTDAGYDQVRAALDAGARVATHLFNAMRPIHHREPGPVVALAEHPDVLVEMIVDGVHLHPALYREVSERVGPGRVALITDAMAAAGMPDGDYRLGELAVEVRAGTARVAGTETIAGSTATMDGVFRNAFSYNGSAGSHGFATAAGQDAALLLAVRQASVNPARVLGLDAGRLAVGSPADLVVLDDLRVARVMRRGSWVARG